MCCRWSLRVWSGNEFGNAFNGRSGALYVVPSSVRRESFERGARILRGGAAGAGRACFTASVGGAVHRRKERRGHGVFFALTSP